MEKNLVRFVWKYGKLDTIKTLIVTFMTFPVIYISLEVPKIIVNDALGAGNEPVSFPTEFLFMSMDQHSYLMALCVIFISMIIINNWLKFILNTQIGLTSERMMRRLRYTLFESVMRFRIRRFQHMKQGEIVQSVMGEVEALSGFFGEVISTPVWQGGMLLVYMTFIFVQDPMLGAAAVALYPIQGFLIPKLQKKVVRLNRERVTNVRRIADNIGESVGAMEDIHTSGTANWHLAVLGDRLYESYRIRLDIFQRKYLVKGLNNFLIALTPFAFYLFGGYLVIEGELQLGSLVAILAAYKDVSGPWKELLNYFQRWSDLNSRFQLVAETFSGDDVHERQRLTGSTDDPEAKLTGDVVVDGVTCGPGSGGLRNASCTAPAGKATAITGGIEGARDMVIRLMAGLIEPDSGRATIGGERIAEAPLPVIARSIAYASAENSFFAGTLRENLTYSLRKAPVLLVKDEREDKSVRSREAKLTGNIPASPFGDWTDYTAAGVDGPRELEERIIELAKRFGLAGELYHLGLQARMLPDAYGDLAERILEARTLIREAADRNQDILEIIESWKEDRLNTNASLLENVLFGMPAKLRPSIADYAADEEVIAILERAHAIRPLLTIGQRIAEQLVELLGALDEGSTLLDSFSQYPKKDILAAAAIVEKAKLKRGKTPKGETRRILLSFAFAFVPARDRLIVLDEELEAELLAARKQARAELEENERIVCFGEECYSPALSLSENILNGKRRHDRRSAWRRLDAFLETAIDEGGLREGVLAAGLSARIGTGGSGLSGASRRRVIIIRALLKRPEILIVDGIAMGDAPEAKEARDLLREEMKGRTLIMAITSPKTAATFDHVINVKNDGTIDQGKGGQE